MWRAPVRPRARSSTSSSPWGFPWRIAIYGARAWITGPWCSFRHGDASSFLEIRKARGGRLLAFSSQADAPYTGIDYQSDDWLLFGRESDGLSPELLAVADLRLTIPMPRSRDAVPGGVRSLNLSVAVGVAVFEALRQLEQRA